MKRLKWVTPLEFSGKDAPDLSKLKVFGCGAYVFIHKDARKNKLSPKSELMVFLGYRSGHESNMIFMHAPNNVLFYGTTALFDETLFPKCPTYKIPPVTQVPNKKKKSTEDKQPTVVIEFGSDSSDDDDDHFPIQPLPSNEQPVPRPGAVPPPIKTDKDRRKALGMQNTAPESVSELPTASSDRVDTFPEFVNSDTEGGVHSAIVVTFIYQ